MSTSPSTNDSLPGAPAERPRRILACDDEPAVTRMLERFLSFGGFEVTTLNDPHQVVATLEANPADLVILDLVLPGKGGRELIAELRSREDALAEVPVLVLTAKVLTPPERAELRRGHATVMQKPFLLHELLQRVQQAVSS